MRWSRRRSRRSAPRRRPAGSATARSSSRASRTRSEFALASAATPPYEKRPDGGWVTTREGRSTNGRQASSGDDQGKGREVRGLPFHRSSRQVAAHGPHGLGHSGRLLHRWRDVRRLLDRRLEGDQRVRHDPDARTLDGCPIRSSANTAHNVQKYKSTLHTVAHSHGKTLTFMPKPLYGDNGSGMHTHQSIWKDNKPLFAGSGYADLSETALYYIGGIIKHAKALNAFCNASTNSYKRVIPGFEPPVLLAYSSRNRSAARRIPYASSPKGKRVEVRFPDPSANPYLAFAAMLMAGIDGINNKIHPGDPMDKNLYDLPPEELSKVPTVAGSLREALNALDGDRTFLTKGGVFTDDQIDAYMELKWEEVYAWEHQPAPIEYKMYYSV